MKIKTTKKQCWPLVSQLYPEYTGRTFSVVVTHCMTFGNTNWGGGTRTEYKAIRADGATASQNVPAPWANSIEGQVYNLVPDVVVVSHGIWCGHDTGITIYVHPDAAVPVMRRMNMIPQLTAQLLIAHETV